VTAFIGKCPAAQSSTARSFFRASEIEGFLENLDFQRLAPEPPFQLSYTLLEATQRWL